MVLVLEQRWAIRVLDRPSSGADRGSHVRICLCVLLDAEQVQVLLVNRLC